MGKISFLFDMFLGAVAFLSVVFVISVIAVYNTKYHYQREAVEKGYAQYRTDTGEWSWKCDLEKQGE